MGHQGGAESALALAERGAPHGFNTVRRGNNFESAGHGVVWALACVGAEKGLVFGCSAPSRG